MWLLIDDERDLNTEVVARTAEAGRRMLSVGGWECVCFDHDLGGAESGYDVLAWGLEHGHIPARVQLVTANPVGMKNMRSALESSGYVTSDGRNLSMSPERASNSGAVHGPLEEDDLFAGDDMMGASG